MSSRLFPTKQESPSTSPPHHTGLGLSPTPPLESPSLSDASTFSRGIGTTSFVFWVISGAFGAPRLALLSWVWELLSFEHVRQL